MDDEYVFTPLGRKISEQFSILISHYLDIKMPERLEETKKLREDFNNWLIGVDFRGHIYMSLEDYIREYKPGGCGNALHRLFYEYLNQIFGSLCLMNKALANDGKIGKITFRMNKELKEKLNSTKVSEDVKIKKFFQLIDYNICSLAELSVEERMGGQAAVGEGQESLMQELVTEYSSFRAHVPTPERKSSRGVTLTGATGSISAHTLYRLLNDETVSSVYCLTRRDNPSDAILNALAQKGLTVPSYRTKKVIALKSTLHEPNMGLDSSTIEQTRQSVSLIIHSAWPVNFNLPLSSFVPHIQGLSNFVDFLMSARMPAPAVMLFCSSISTAPGSASPDIEEGPMRDFSCALDMGYARSKLVREEIISNARKAGARAFSLRIGQVSGHSKKGLWNDSEAIPLMLRSALTLKALPGLDTVCSWLPADKLASSVLEIARARSLNSLDEQTDGSGTDSDDSVYNLCNPRTITWSAMLDALPQHGFEFETVPFSEWLQKLRDSEARGEEMVNPAVKLADHYEAMYGGETQRRRFSGRTGPSEIA
ncbi:male sterility protein-domain-containing protein [Aspergillus aurantiobrunneus]